jgi:hypothetical protein
VTKTGRLDIDRSALFSRRTSHDEICNGLTTCKHLVVSPKRSTTPIRTDRLSDVKWLGLDLLFAQSFEMAVVLLWTTTTWLVLFLGVIQQPLMKRHSTDSAKYLVSPFLMYPYLSWTCMLQCSEHLFNSLFVSVYNFCTVDNEYHSHSLLITSKPLRGCLSSAEMQNHVSLAS